MCVSERDCMPLHVCAFVSWIACLDVSICVSEHGSMRSVYGQDCMPRRVFAYMSACLGVYVHTLMHA